MGMPPRGVNPTEKPVEERLRELEDQVQALRSTDLSPDAILGRAWPELRFWQGLKYEIDNSR
ncbi:MAG: hypothetical protein KDA64_18770 [Rhodospirillaceae bacterium]|nr:hypothetical protein [Rhodospirillaceae bacterium]